MSVEFECPSCGEMRELPSDAPIGTRALCRRCWAVLEICSLQPPQVVKIRLCAEDFGI